MKWSRIAVVCLVGVVPAIPVTSIEEACSMNSETIGEYSAPDRTEELAERNAEGTADIVDSDLQWCWSFFGEDEDTYLICCTDIWVMTVCVAVNVSAMGRELLIN